MRVVFDRFVFDLEKRQLSSDGVLVHISQRAFRMLELLLKAAPAAVSKDVLYRGLWGETFVAEANIPNVVSELRAALGDDRDKPRLITTVHRRGYRFDGELRPPEVRPNRPRFVVVWGEREYRLREGRHVIGRDASVDVPIDSQGISRQHALLTVESDHATIEDLESKNGTFVRGKRIRTAVNVSDGEHLRFGSVSVTFRKIEDDLTKKTAALE
jgi:DNA-binding winged-HTH domains